MAKLIYGSGTRLMECLRLRGKDLEFDRRAIIVRDGKGTQDRVTVLPDSFIPLLKEHLQRVKTDVQAGQVQEAGGIYLAALAINSRIARGIPLAGSRTRSMASCGQWETHTPQPMQAEASMRANPSSTEIATNWQKSAQVPQAAHSSASTWATKPEEASIGVPCR
jgi:hypothetical protein